MLSLSFVCLSGAAVFRPATLGNRLTEFVSHRVLVLGTGAQAAMVHGALLDGARSGMQCVGFLPTSGPIEHRVPTHQVLSSRMSLAEAVREFRVNEVVVAVQQQRGGILPIRELLSCRLQGILVSDPAGFFERVRGELPLDALKASWLIYGDGFRQSLARRLVKRAFDVIASMILLVVTAPVMLVTAIAIAMESGRPVIFRQERVGLNGKSFVLLKFRSMRTDAEKDGAPKWAAANDPRVTRVGAFIRKVRIDELPQLFNVLKGEMSFVGPRPERPVLRRPVDREDPVLRCAAQREAGHHRLGPGALHLRRVAVGFDPETPVRPVLREEPQPAARPGHPVRHDPGGVEGRGRSLSRSGGGQRRGVSGPAGCSA